MVGVTREPSQVAEHLAFMRMLDERLSVLNLALRVLREDNARLRAERTRTTGEIIDLSIHRAARVRRARQPQS